MSRRGTKAALLLGGLLAFQPISRAAPLDALIARVGRSVVTLSQVFQEARIQKWDPSEGVQGSPGTVAAGLVRRRLYAAEAEKLNLAPAEEQIRESVDALASARGQADVFWSDMTALGVSESDLRARARDLLLMRRYLEVRRGMVHVPESEVRAFVSEHASVLGEASPEVQEAVRTYLVDRKHRQELKRWLERQVAEGRVRLLDGAALPSGTPLQKRKLAGQGFSHDDTVLFSLLSARPECIN